MLKGEILDEGGDKFCTAVLETHVNNCDLNLIKGVKKVYVNDFIRVFWLTTLQ